MKLDSLCRYLPVLLLAAGCASVDSSAPQAADPDSAAAGTAELQAAPERSEAALTEPVDAPEEKPKEYGDREGIRRSLDEVLDRKEPWDGLDVEMGCLTEQGFTTLSILSNGIGIWDETSQFELSEVEVRDALVAFRDAGFADLELIYGGKKDPAPKDEGGASATRVVCRISLELRGAAKAVTQLYGGRQSAPLRQLADRLFDLARGPAERGVTAADLDQALALVADGTLAPEAFGLLLHRKGEAESSDDGWILRLEGLHASSRPYLPNQGMGSPVHLELSPEELAVVAEAVRAADPDRMPGNLWAVDYTDFSISVLNHKKTVQARQFAGMTADTHGEAQIAFDTMTASLVELNDHVQTAGQPVAE